MTKAEAEARAEASARSNEETALRNAVINGTADALISAGVPAAKIAAARAWVEAHRASKRDPARVAMIQRDAAGDKSGAVYTPPGSK